MRDRTILSPDSSISRLRVAGSFASFLAAGGLEVSDPGVITTARLTLRPMGEADRVRYMEMLRVSRRRLDRFLPLHGPVDRDEGVFERQLQYSRAAATTPGRGWRRVVVHNGRLVGAVNLNDIQRGDEQSAELVVWISTDCGSRGFATEATERAALHALARPPYGLGLELVYGLVSPRNAGVLRVFEKAKFREEPNLPMIELNINGHWRAHSMLIRESVPPAAPAHSREVAKVVVRRLMMAGGTTGAVPA